MVLRQKNDVLFVLHLVFGIDIKLWIENHINITKNLFNHHQGDEVEDTKTLYQEGQISLSIFSI
jgi:hypothetical protein